MGIFSRKTTTTNTSNITNVDNTDKSAQVGGGLNSVGLAIGTDANTNVVINDKELVEQAIENNEKSTGRAYDFLNDIGTGLLQLFDRNSERNTIANASATNQALITADANNKLKQGGLETTATRQQDNIQIAIILVAIVGGYYIITKTTKKPKKAK